MSIYFLQPLPETRLLISKEAHVFKEEGGGILIINGFYENTEDALYRFGKRLGVTLSFEPASPEISAWPSGAETMAAGDAETVAADIRVGGGGHGGRRCAYSWG